MGDYIQFNVNKHASRFSLHYLRAQLAVNEEYVCIKICISCHVNVQLNNICPVLKKSIKEQQLRGHIYYIGEYY